MSPVALVQITLREIEFADALLEQLALVSARGASPYLLATIGERRIGRSRVIPGDTSSFDLRVDPSGFVHELRVEGSQIVPLRLEIWADDDESAPIGILTDGLAGPWESAPWTSSQNGLTLRYDVVARLIPTRLEGVAARAADGTTTLATLRVIDTVAVRITRVEGLYKPDPPFAIGKRGAIAVDHYKSQDDRGRIYLNRDLHNHFRANHQLIVLHASVDVLRGHLPDGAKIRWTIVDVDDPFNDDPTVHLESGAYADFHDHDPHTGKNLGARGNDNEGTRDHDPAWEMVKPYALEIDWNDRALTSVVAGKSRVTLHCTNMAGDNLVVRAELVADTPFESFADQTGIMTLWNRVDLAYLRMKSALPLPLDRAARGFEPACLQLDVAPERIIPDVPFFAADENSYRKRLKSVFAVCSPHGENRGWGLALAALRAFKTPPQVPPLYEGMASVFTLKNADGTPYLDKKTLKRLEYVDLPGDCREAFAFRFVWAADESTEPCSAEFFRDSNVLFKVHGQKFTRCFLQGHTYWTEFRAHDFGPTSYFGMRFQKGTAGSRPGGYRVPEGPLFVTVTPEGNRPILGETDGNKEGSHCRERVAIFTASIQETKGHSGPTALTDELAITLLHELTHGFDFPHMCGSWDYRTERKRSCVMNYLGQWLVKPELPVPKTLLTNTGDGPLGELCARHIKELRRTHLEDNPLRPWR